MATDSVMKWYVVRAIGGQENKVKSYIETEISRVGLSDYVSQVIVPTEKVFRLETEKKFTEKKFIFLVTLWLRRIFQVKFLT